MKLRKRALILFKRLRMKGSESLRKIEQKTLIPKSSVHRQMKNQKRRIEAVGHSFFETEAGIAWLHRLFMAVLLVFGLQSGVGSEAISLFFNMIMVATYIATSPTSIRDSKQKMRNGIDAFGAIHMPSILKFCETHELHLGADETVFGSEQFLLLMELTSGFIFTEALVTDRTTKTWKDHTVTLLDRFKKICSFASDGGRALLNMGKSVFCDNVMDLFHFLQDMSRLFATKFHSKRRALTSQLETLKKDTLVSAEDRHATEKTINDSLSLLNKGQATYRQCLFAVSTQVHPFKNISEIKYSEELETQLDEQVEKLKTVAEECNIKDNGKLLQRIQNRVKPSSRLNDLWHRWVAESLQCKTNDMALQNWLIQALLPYHYWTEQLRKSKRKHTLRVYYQNIVEQAKIKLDAHPLTLEYLTDDWIHWANAMAKKYQRTTSAIEGRNARLSQHYFSTRGVRGSHVNALTVMHNFWIKRHDGRTAAMRLTGAQHPNLFEWLLGYMPDLSLPRKGHKKSEISLCAIAA